MKDFGNCETENSNSNIVITDSGSKNNRSKFRLDNPQRASIRVVQVDDCAITKGIRCDYLLILLDGQELYIELKGSDVRHAVEQIVESINQLTCHQQCTFKWCFIASTRCPINSTEIQILKKKFKKNYNAKLIIKNGEIIHKI